VNSKQLTVILSILILAANASAAEVRAMRFDAKTPEEARKWQAAAREKLFALMMGGKRPDRVPLDPKVIQSIPQDGYTLEEITIQTLPDRRAHVWVAMPDSPKGKVPAVLALHGHNASGEKMLRREMQYWYWYAPALAELGYAVIAPDIGSHDLSRLRRDPVPQAGQHADWTLMGERTWDAIRCIDYILTRPEVDPKGIAVCGLSLGGETTMYVAAMDERVKVADSSGWLTTIENTKNGHCPCWDFPGLEGNFEFSDIFSCIAPRPLICEIGTEEKAPGGFPVPFAEKAFAEIKRVYRVFGKEDAAVLDIHPGGHVFSGSKFWKPLRKAMGTPRPLKKTKDIWIRDPFILPVPEEQSYYMYGTTGRGFSTYVSADLKEWEGPINVFKPDKDFWGNRDFWAAEVHKYKSKYYMFCTFGGQQMMRRSQILVADHPSGPFEPLTDQPITPSGWQCLDATLFIDDANKPWTVFCREWEQTHDGEIWAMPLTDDLKNSAGKPTLLFKASEAPWIVPVPWNPGEEGAKNYITDGPFILRLENKQLLMLWSSFGKTGYVQAVAHSESGKITGPWKQDPKLLYDHDGGHGMIFPAFGGIPSGRRDKTFDGRLMLTLHAPNSGGKERAHLFPIEEKGDSVVIRE
jgi:arabinan endo-1,5-alpha-L-arabinosidase